MKKLQKCLGVKTPTYLEWFSVMHYDCNFIEIGFLVPFKVFFIWMYYLIPQKIYNYQIKDCINYFPDVVSSVTNKRLSGNKITPWFGLIILIDENNAMRKQWWKNIRRYKIYKYESN